MRSRRTIWILVCLLCMAGAWLLLRSAGSQHVARKNSVVPASSAIVQSISKTPAGFFASTNAAQAAALSAATNKLAYRLSNTAKTIGELLRDDKAILLDNAFIDTSAKINLSIPKHLQSPGDPGAYIVQARGAINNAFRALLAGAGAQIISYIPNDAYLVHISSGVADGLAANSLVQAVIPYEPYYKIQLSLLDA